MITATCCLGVGDQGGSQPRNVQSSRVISCPVPATMLTPEPCPPVRFFGAVVRRAISIGEFAASWARMGGVSGLLPFEPHPCQVAFVAKHLPQLASHL